MIFIKQSVSTTARYFQGDNAAIIYEALNGTETFMVNNKTGEVRVKSAANLDREKYPVLTFLVCFIYSYMRDSTDRQNYMLDSCTTQT